MQKKDDVATNITTIKNDYVTNASLTSQLNDLKSQHIATEVKGIDNKTKKNASDILTLENQLKQKEDTINENERGLSFNRGFFYYLQQSHFVYEYRTYSFNYTNNRVSGWKSAGVFNYPDDDNMKDIENTKINLPELKNDGRMYVYLQGNYFKQNSLLNTNKVISTGIINIYCVYKLHPIASSRDTSFTIQDALFGVMQITKNATDNSKNNYKGYGICFDEGSQFGHTRTEGGRTYTTNGRNVLIFGADMSFSVHRANRANYVYVMGDGPIQGFHDTALYAEKKYFRNFTEPNVKFVLSLHYNGNDSYLFVNGREELKFKAKNDQIISEKICLGNLSDQWTTSESEKTGLYGNIYDFVVDFKQIVGVKTIHDMHRYLMVKHNISP